METSPTSSTLTFISPAWPVRLTGASVFLITLFIFLTGKTVPVAIPLIVFCFMLVALFLSSNTSVSADSIARTLTVTKKRIVGSTCVVYPYADIVFIYQTITSSVNTQGVESKNSSFYITLKSEQTSSMYYQGRKPIPLPIPTNSFTALNQTVRSFQELARARELANFIGVSFYVQGSEHDTLINTAEDLPYMAESIGKIPEALKQAKEENDRVAQEILNSKERS